MPVASIGLPDRRTVPDLRAPSAVRAGGGGDGLAGVRPRVILHFCAPPPARAGRRCCTASSAFALFHPAPAILSSSSRVHLFAPVDRTCLWCGPRMIVLPGSSISPFAFVYARASVQGRGFFSWAASRYP